MAFPKEGESRQKPLSDFVIDVSSLNTQTLPPSHASGRVQLFKGDGKRMLAQYLESDS